MSGDTCGRVPYTQGETCPRCNAKPGEPCPLPPYEVTQVQMWVRPFSDAERAELGRVFDRIFGAPARVTLTVPPDHVPGTVEPLDPADLVLDRDVRK